MNRTYLFSAMGLVCLVSLAGWAEAQVQSGEAFFQPAASLPAFRGGRGGVVLPMIPAQAGKPFSAMAISQSEQTYLDGTRVTHAVTMMEYRDMEGRTREEPAEPPEPVKQIMIRDPVAGVRYRVDIAGKTATKTVLTGVSALPTVQSPLGTFAPTEGGRGGRGGNASSDSAEVRDYQKKVAQTARKPSDIVEDLGTMSLNGVLARGTRTTVVVPAGAIGNDREFRSVEERWFSDELNLLIRSISTDPRFGTTTYERKNVSRQTPDPSLFQVPAGYNVVSN